MGIHFEVLFAAGYTTFLVGVALGLDLMARHSHKRSERYRTAGFAYHPTHDAWLCPEDQLLVRDYTDHERRLVVYRGRPQICNHCPSKDDCTDSHEGREVARAMDPWPHSEAGRFHRGVSLVIASAAVPFLVVEAIRNHSPVELTILGSLFVVVMLVAWRLHAAFRTTPANFPTHLISPPQATPQEGSPAGYRKSKSARRR